MHKPLLDDSSLVVQLLRDSLSENHLRTNCRGDHRAEEPDPAIRWATDCSRRPAFRIRDRRERRSWLVVYRHRARWAEHPPGKHAPHVGLAIQCLAARCRAAGSRAAAGGATHSWGATQTARL